MLSFGRITAHPYTTLAGDAQEGNLRAADDPDTIREVTRSGHDLSISHVNMLGEGNGAEDRIDIEDGDAVLAPRERRILLPITG
jgi:hypothetical protein